MPGNLSLAELGEKARQARVETLKMTYGAGSGHPGGSFSMAEFLVALYYNKVNVSPQNPKDPDRDIFILSKGHCAPGLYAVLGDLGFFPKTEFAKLRRFGSLLQGHADRKIPGVEMSTGSLGMGLGYGNGIALAKRIDGRKGSVYVVLGDGELQEGNIWESALTSSHRKLDNVCVIVDANKIQIDGWTKDVKDLGDIEAKFKAFGFWTKTVPGHDLAAILKAYDEADAVVGQPQCLVMNTDKGHGVSFMIGKPEFHGRALTKDEMVKAMAELGEKWTPEVAA
ncbi:MAG: transketolase [Candidatus Thermoplasmatota archaeon]